MEKHVGLQLVSDPLLCPDSQQTHKPTIHRSDALDTENPTCACADFLASSERAQEQWRPEAELVDFENLSWAH